MSKDEHEGGLEVDEDLSFQRREWVAQRIGWAILGVLVLGAVGGVFGHGPLAHARTNDEAGVLHVSYDRFLRYHAPTELALRVQGAPGEYVLIWIDRSYIEAMEVERITPEPESVAVAPDGVVYEFRTVGARRPVEITFALRPRQAWGRRGQVAVAGLRPVRFGHFIYP